MIKWEANFQIPNSGVQAREVYAEVESDNSTVNFYADKEKTLSLFVKNYTIPKSMDPYEYLLGLEEFSNYTRV